MSCGSSRPAPSPRSSCSIPRRPNAFVALARLRAGDGGWRYGLACVDISTGAFDVAEVGEAELAGELARLEPREIVAAEALCADAGLAAQLDAISTRR